MPEKESEKENKGIERKIQMLVEVVEYISNSKWWDEEVLKELIECMNYNLFRTLPNVVPRKSVKGDEEEEPFADPNWRHLQLVYELCLRFLISNEIDKKVSLNDTCFFPFFRFVLSCFVLFCL